MIYINEDPRPEPKLGEDGKPIWPLPLGHASFSPGTLYAVWGDEGVKWKTTSRLEELESLRKEADYLSGLKTYSSADGDPGYRIAAEVSKELGGTWHPDEPLPITTNTEEN